MLVSESILREYLDVIRRPKFNIPAEEITAIVDYLFKNVEFVTPLHTVVAVEADPSDNKFLETALEGNAMCVVSGDNHLLDLQSIQDIPVLTATEFIERLLRSVDDA